MIQYIQETCTTKTLLFKILFNVISISILQLRIIEKKFKILMDNKLFDYIEVMNGSTTNIITIGISHNRKTTREIASSLYEYTIGAKK